jgi:hypothetical protein
MQLKQSKRTFQPASILKKLWQRKTALVMLLLLWTFLIFTAGYLVRRSGFSAGLLIWSLLDDFYKTQKKAEAYLNSPEIEHLTIDVNHENFMRLAYQREIALNKFLLLTDAEDFVPADLTVDGETVNADIRIKGDFLDHLEDKKWSFRIIVDGDDTLFDMKRFSIQHPKTRNYVYEWLYHQARAREGLVSLRYQFIDVTVNGEDWGIYALEEHFDKRLLENNELREGPIVRFNEEMRWAERFLQRPHLPDPNPHEDNLFLTVDIDTFQTGQMLTDPTTYAQHTQAIYLLESFRRGDLQTSEVFDIESLAKFYAINDLMGSQHSNSWGNIRFYFNPVTSLLEPIGYDGDSGLRIDALSHDMGPAHGPLFFQKIFSDPLLVEEYIKTLERISEPEYLDSLLADTGDDLEQNLNILHSEYPDFEFSTDSLYQNQQFIKKALNPLKGLHAYIHQVNQNGIELELGNIQSLPIEVLGVSVQGDVLFQPNQRVILSGRPTLEPDQVDYEIIQIDFPEDFTWSEEMMSDLILEYRLLGASQIRQEIIFPWSYLPDNFVDEDLIRSESNAHEFEFLEIDDAAQEIIVKAGAWTLDRDLIIPEESRFFMGAGTQLDLVGSAKILSYSPIELTGSEEQPIVIQSSDSSGQGILVMGTEEISVVDYVSFDNLSNPTHGNWELTGAITFYEAPVLISHTRFMNSRSEDALNIIRSKFSIEDSVFFETAFDALDADFSNGIIADTNFVNSGNDAVDVSGSAVDIRGLSINGAGDKGLSVGENSQVVAANLEISDALIGLASKDESSITIQNSEISNSEYGVAAYVKKSEFGSATVDAQSLTMAQVKTPYLVEEGSEVVLDGVSIEANQTNVYEMLYGSE